MRKEVLIKAKAYVVKCFVSDIPESLVYHNLSHTQEVVSHCQRLADHYSIDINEKYCLEIAAWFHDIGYLYSTPEKHEEKSVEILHSFLANECSDEELLLMENIILATKSSMHPDTLLQCIIRDADTYHFGTEDFLISDELVKKEMELLTGIHFPNWKEQSLHLLKSHKFYTSYCTTHLIEGKQKNISILQSQT